MQSGAVVAGADRLPQAILQTLAYFDVFDYPLTAVEVHKFLWRQKATLLEVLEILETMEAASQVGRRFGYACLPGREVLAETRWQRYLLAEPKYRRVLRAARWLRLLPDVHLIAVCNNLAYGNAKPESDLDLFIVSAPRRIWLTRLLVTGVVQLLGLRRHRDKIVDRCCLSFYVTADATDLCWFALAPHDPYLVYWLATLAIVYARPTAVEGFWRANGWVNEWLQNFQPRVMSARRTIRPRPWRLPLGGVRLERLARRLQLDKMRRRRRQQPAGIGVVISDMVLKFHEEDRRESYRQQWQERLSLERSPANSGHKIFSHGNQGGE